jgi:flagellar biogenesis protein FliO
MKSRAMLEMTGGREALEWSAAGILGTIANALARAFRQVRFQKKIRALRVEETLPLGDRRFLAVVKWENERMLIGVTAQSITLLDPREPRENPNFSGKGEHRA